MAVNNRIARSGGKLKESDTNRLIEYKSGDETVKLSPSIIRQYLVSGNGDVSDQEVVMFLNMCRFQHLNPFLREAYLIKYGNQPATMVIGKDAITKRAMKNDRFEGQQAGIVVLDTETGELEYRNGALVIPEIEKIVGGWAKVFVKGYQEPIEAVVSFDEYAGRKNDGSLNSQWAKKPATMIRKVALVQALREAFPEDLGGMYDSSEMGVEIDESSMAPITLPDELPTPQQAPTIDPPPQQTMQRELVAQPQQQEFDDLTGVF